MKTKKLPQAIAALKKYKEQNKLSFHELENQTGIASATLSGWCTGRIVPLHSSLEKVKLFLDRQYSNEFSKKFSNDVDYIDSRLIAEWIGRDHKNLLSDIRKHIEHLEKLDNEFRGGNRYQPPHQNADITSPYRPELYFIKATYVHSQNKMTLPYYLVTQLGCDLIRNRLKGVRGTQFAVLYINEFHRLRNEAEAIPAPQEAPQIEQESLFDDIPQTEDERDLAYLKQRLLDDLEKSTDPTELGYNIVGTLKVIRLLDENKNKNN